MGLRKSHDVNAVLLQHVPDLAYLPAIRLEPSSVKCANMQAMLWLHWGTVASAAALLTPAFPSALLAF
jgi:hypothetical protein